MIKVPDPGPTRAYTGMWLSKPSRLTVPRHLRNTRFERY